MTKTIRTTIVSACALALVACGGNGDGPKVADKKTAAAVLLGVANTTQQGGGNDNQVRAAVSQGPAQGGEQKKEDEVSCPKGGKVKMKEMSMLLNGQDLSSGNFSGGNPFGDSEDFNITLKATANYDECVVEYDNPETEAVETEELTLDGDMKVEITVSGLNSGSGKMVFGQSGKLEVSGAIDDTFDTNVVQTIDIASTNSAEGLKLTLDGYTKTSGQEFKFDKETFTFASNYGGDMAKDLNAGASEMGKMGGNDQKNPFEDTDMFKGGDDFGG